MYNIFSDKRNSSHKRSGAITLTTESSASQNKFLTQTAACLFMACLSYLPQQASAVYTGAPVTLAPQLNQVIVKYRDEGMSVSARGEMSRAVLDGASKTLKTEMKQQQWLGIGAQVVSMESRAASLSMEKIISVLKADPRVEYVYQDRMMQPTAVPSDPGIAQQWHYDGAPGSINLQAGWALAYPDGFDGDSRLSEVVVAVIDTGSLPHGDLVDITLQGHDFITNTFTSRDGDGRDDDATDAGDFSAPGACGPQWPGSTSSWHGTHVMGTVGAATHNDVGVAGVAPNARIVPIRALGRCGGALSDISDSILWAAGLDVPGAPENENPAQVINLSLGGFGACIPPMQEAVTAARNAGAVVVVAAGNSNTRAENFSPGNCNGAFTVAAVHAGGGRAGYSNFGNNVAVAAPGGNGPTIDPPDNGVISTLDFGQQEAVQDAYGPLVGTSMAAPHVAGVAALAFGANPELTPAQVENLLIGTVQDFPENCGLCGVGIVDAGAIIAATLPPLEEEEEAVEEEVVDEEVEEEVVEEVEEDEEVIEDVLVEEEEEVVEEEEEVVEEENLPTVDLGLFVTGVQTALVPGTESEGPDGVEIVQRVTSYTLTIRNLTNEIAQNVTLTTTFPEVAELVSLEISQGACTDDGISCEAGDIDALGEVALDVAVSFFGPTAAEALEGNAGDVSVINDTVIESVVSAENTDLQSENNSLSQPLANGLGGLILAGLGLLAALRASVLGRRS